MKNKILFLITFGFLLAAFQSGAAQTLFEPSMQYESSSESHPTIREPFSSQTPSGLSLPGALRNNPWGGDDIPDPETDSSTGGETAPDPIGEGVWILLLLAVWYSCSFTLSRYRAVQRIR